MCGQEEPVIHYSKKNMYTFIGFGSQCIFLFSTIHISLMDVAYPLGKCVLSNCHVFYREKRSTMAEIVEQLQEREAAQVRRLMLCVCANK